MHIQGVLPTFQILCLKSMGFWDCYRYVPFFLNWDTKVISNVFMFSLNVYLPQNIDMSLSQVQWYSQNLEKQKPISGSTLT